MSSVQSVESESKAGEASTRSLSQRIVLEMSASKFMPRSCL